MTGKDTNFDTNNKMFSQKVSQSDYLIHKFS